MPGTPPSSTVHRSRPLISLPGLASPVEAGQRHHPASPSTRPETYGASNDPSPLVSDQLWMDSPTDELTQAPSRKLHADRPHSARVYNCWLGGKDNFPADREVAERVAAVWPGVRTSARENRGFLHRTVRVLAERGVRQFLDVGTGLPLAPNTHSIAQSVDPQARVVYVDNDPMVLAHARALLTGSGTGPVRYVEEDLLNPEKILASADGTLDLGLPVAVLLLAVLHFVPDPQEARALVSRYLEPLPSGSAVVISHGCPEGLAPETAQSIAQLYGQSIQGSWASAREIGELFGPVELLDPGVVPVSRWRRPDEFCPPDSDIALYGGVGIKP